MACGHLGWKWHPEGGLAGEGTSPSKRIIFLPFPGSILGMAENRARVYGCLKSSKISPVVPRSTMRPRYITITSSAKYSTMERS